MEQIPKTCPKCGSEEEWKEKINIVTRGIPIGKHCRIRLLYIRGGYFMKALEKKLGCHLIKYRCKRCGHEEAYDCNPLF